MVKLVLQGLPKHNATESVVSMHQLVFNTLTSPFGLEIVEPCVSLLLRNKSPLCDGDRCRVGTRESQEAAIKATLCSASALLPKLARAAHQRHPSEHRSQRYWALADHCLPQVHKTSLSANSDKRDANAFALCGVPQIAF